MKKLKVINKQKSISPDNNIKLPLIKLNNSRKSAQIISSNNIKIKKEKLSEINENKGGEIIKEEEENENNEDIKINEIINKVNKNHNFFSKIITDTKKSEENDNISIDNKLREKNTIEQNNITKIETNDITKIDSKDNKDNKPKKYFNKKYHYYNNIFSNKNKSNIETPKETILIPRITKEKLKELKEKRQKRLIQEKKEKDILDKMMEKIGKEKNSRNPTNIFNNNSYSNIKITGDKIITTLEESGILDAYKYLIDKLHRDGLPPGSLYEYSSKIIKEYENKWKKKKIKIKIDNIEKYFEDIKKNYIKSINDENNKSNNISIYKVLKERENNQFIKKLDRSRSSLHIMKKNTSLIDKSKEKDLNSEDKIKKLKKIKIRKKIDIKKEEVKTINDIPQENKINTEKETTIDPKLFFKITLKKNNEALKGINEVNNNLNISNNSNLNISKNLNTNLIKEKIIEKDKKRNNIKKIDKSIKLKKNK